MPLSIRENYLRTVEMREPEWIPCTVGFQMSTWSRHREGLEEVVIRHPFIFGNYKKGSINFDDFGLRRKGEVYRDEWGCVWYHIVDGLVGQVKEHPIEDWKALGSYEPPDPFKLKGPPLLDVPPIETWEQVRKRLKEDKKRGILTCGFIFHDALFQRIYDLRGFKNFLIDTITQPEKLKILISMVVEYNLEQIKWWLENDVDIIVLGDDLGTQTKLTINPEIFRKLFIPAYTEMFRPCREVGVHVYLHSDGYLMEIAEDLVKAGVSVLNPQDMVNGIDNIAKICKGKVCIDLDIDRQGIMPFGTTEKIKEHIRNAVLKLGSKRGGLMLKADIYPDVPLNNIEALCQAMEEYRYYYFRERL